MKTSALLLSLIAATQLLTAAVDPYDQSKAPLEVDSPDASRTKILVLAGGPSSKAMAHEYFAGSVLLTRWLNEQTGVWAVMARDWPKNPDVLKNVKCVVYYGDGGGKQPFVDPARWAKLTELMNAGAGFVLLHQAMDFPTGADAEKLKQWHGAVFHGDIGCRGHWDMEFPTIPAHAVTRGVKPFAAPGDGWLYNLHFADKGVTPVLTGLVPENSRKTADAKSHVGRAETIAWVYERPGKGRGFGFTGADLHKSWGYESQRTLVVNGILWSAGLEVPKEGAKTTFAESDLNQNLDDKRKAAAPAAEKKAKAKTKAK